METQENNKLIAEFMGFTKDSKELYLIDDYTLRSEDEYQATYVDEMKFHTSWDWLMPVHKKCMFTKQFTGDDQLRTLLIDAVIDADIDRLHKAVVEFINQYNN